mgnify:CR=1 FL=1
MSIELKVGDDVWYVPFDKRHSNPNGCLVKVTKVGRKYVYVGEMKMEYWEFDGFSIGNIVDFPYGTVYKSSSDYYEKMEWNNFKQDVGCLILSREQKKGILDIAGESCKVI